MRGILTGHVIFELRYNQIYQLKTTLVYYAVESISKAMSNVSATLEEISEICKFLNDFRYSLSIYLQRLILLP